MNFTNLVMPIQQHQSHQKKRKKCQSDVVTWHFDVVTNYVT